MNENSDDGTQGMNAARRGAAFAGWRIVLGRDSSGSAYEPQLGERMPRYGASSASAVNPRFIGVHGRNGLRPSGAPVRRAVLERQSYTACFSDRSEGPAWKARMKLCPAASAFRSAATRWALAGPRWWAMASRAALKDTTPVAAR